MSLGVLCSGQGGQSAGMLDLIETHDSARDILEIAAPFLGASIRSILAYRANMYHNIIAQPTLCAVQLATWEALKSNIVRPTVFAGYSVGELAAYGCAGTLTPSDAIALAADRARLMTEACHEPCGMMAVQGIRRGMIEELAKHNKVYLSIINEHDHFIVGGFVCHIRLFEKASRAAGARTTPLPIDVPSHTPLMRTAAKTFSETLARTDLHPPLVRVLSAIDGLPPTSAERIAASLREQICTTLDWAACMSSLQEFGCTAVLELGPGNCLARMLRRSHPYMPVRAVSEFCTLRGVVAWVNKLCPDP